MPNRRRVGGFALSGGFVLTMILAIAIPLGYLAIDHANANQDRATRHSNALTEKKFNQALAVVDQKFEQALRISTYSINRSVCGFYKLIDPALRIALKRREDKTLTAAEHSANEATINRLEAFLATQVTVPSDFDCKTLPKNPPKGTP